MTNIVPAEQMDAIGRTRYVWFSYAHPDHLDGESLEAPKEKEILLPDHVGRRIHRDLSKLGFRVRILPERQWVELSKNIRIFVSPTSIRTLRHFSIEALTTENVRFYDSCMNDFRSRYSTGLARILK